MSSTPAHVEPQEARAAPSKALGKISVVIPAVNEAESLEKLLPELLHLPGLRFHEIIVVDDGSTDKTAEVVSTFEGVIHLRNPYNHGNGAAVKKGIRYATGDLVLVLDADGQHSPQQIPKLLEHMGEYDLVVGCRSEGTSPMVRNFGNVLLSELASILSGVQIPDLTSGFRVGRRSILMEFMHLYPNGFSLPSTSTLAFLSAGYSVKFVAVQTHYREKGKSKIRLFRDTARFLVILIRMISTFYPLKVFVPGCLFCFGMAVFWTLRTMRISGQVSALGATFMIIGVFLLLFGLLADQVASIRLELGRLTRGKDS